MEVLPLTALLRSGRSSDHRAPPQGPRRPRDLRAGRGSRPQQGPRHQPAGGEAGPRDQEAGRELAVGQLSGRRRRVGARRRWAAQSGGMRVRRGRVVRGTGFEPAYPASEAVVLPLHYPRTGGDPTGRSTWRIGRVKISALQRLDACRSTSGPGSRPSRGPQSPRTQKPPASAPGVSHSPLGSSDESRGPQAAMRPRRLPRPSQAP